MALCVLAVLALPTTGVADNVGRLRSQEATLSARERSARIELFAVDSRLARARAALASIRSQIAGLDQERRSALLALGASRRTLSRSERLLGQQVRLLYVQDDVDPLAVFLGAASIEDAIDRYDSLRRAANAASSGVADANRARAGVLHILSSLAARRNRLERLQAAASAQGRILADAVQERRSYLARLQTERGLTQEQIAAAEARAQAAQAAAEVATVEAEAAGSIGALSAEPLTPVRHSAGPTSTGTGRRTLTVLATAYTLRGRTATGLLTGPGIVAVDPTVIPLGTRMTIPGYGQAVAADTGSAIKGLRIDLWVATDREARAWSWRRVTITLR